jgi:hypothetical protein
MDMLSYHSKCQTKSKLLNVRFVIQTERLMKIKLILYMLMLMVCTGCSEFALLASGSSIAISQNAYARAYSGADMLTIMSTEKSLKKHAYDKVKEVIDDKKSND